MYISSEYNFLRSYNVVIDACKYGLRRLETENTLTGFEHVLVVSIPTRCFDYVNGKVNPC